MDSAGKESESIETENPSPSDTSPKSHQNSPTCTPNAKHQPPMELDIYDYFPRASDLLISVSARADVNKHKITNLVISAVEEIRQLVIEQEALWVFHMEAGTFSLNIGEYKRRFSPLDPTLDEIVRMIKTQEPILGIPPYLNEEVEIWPGVVGPACLEREASREIGVVCMNPVDLVQMFMDVDQWSRMFSSIVSRAETLEVISEGNGSSLDGALQVMTAEFHISSPLVQTRESYFARYSKQLAVNFWAVVDVSLESIFPNPTARFFRRPSGCFIQSMGNGYSKVLWIEHLEVDNTLVHHLFKPLVASGLAYGARRWLGTLACGCDRLQSYMDDRVAIMQDGRKSILKLADRMVRSYHAGVSASPENTWRPVPIAGAEDILVTTSYNDNHPETPRGVSITVATTIRLPNHPKNIFDFLQNGNHRGQWDLLCLKRCTQEATRVGTGHDPANCVSIIKIDTFPLIFYLQESNTTSTGSYVVYAPVDLFAMNSMLSGADPNNIQILASGFAILPDGAHSSGEENGGTLLTIAIRVVDQLSSTPEYLPPASVFTVYTTITQTVQLIRAAVAQ